MNNECEFPTIGECTTPFANDGTMHVSGFNPDTIVSISLAEHQFVLQMDDKGESEVAVPSEVIRKSLLCR